MKKLNKIFVLFLIFLTLFIYKIDVFAYKQKVDSSVIRTTDRYKYHYTRSAKKGSKYKYENRYIVNGNDYWCLDPSAKGNSKQGCKTELTIDDSTSAALKMMSLIAVMDINAYCGTAFGDLEVYQAKTFAIRAINCGNGLCVEGGISKSSNSIFDALYNRPEIVVIDKPSHVETCVKSLVQHAKDCSNSGFTGANCTISSGGGNNKPVVKFHSPSLFVNEAESSDTLQSRHMFIRVDLSDFSDAGSFTIGGASVTNRNSTISFVGASNKFSKDIEDYRENAMATNAFQLFSSSVVNNGGAKSLTFYIAYKINTIVDLNATPVCNSKAIINYNYSYPSSQATIYYCPPGNNNQAFLGAEMGTGTGGETPADGTHETPSIVVCDPTCDPIFDIPLICKDGMTYDTDGNINGSFKEGYDKQGKLNIKRCIINNTDKKGNTYENRSIGLNNNPYCSVFCKEDLNVKLPYKRQTYNGRYFDIPIYLEGTQSCYTDELNYAKFEENFAACGGNRACEKTHVDLYNQCASWTASYNFSPNLSYNYGESCNSGSKKFINLPNTLGGPYNTYVFPDGLQVGAATTTYCAGSINDDYSCQSGARANNYMTNYRGYQITAIKYIKAVQTKLGKLDTRRVYYTNNSTGQVEIHASSPNDAMYVDGLPIAYDTPKGIYYYKITLNGIGTFYGENRTGRIYGTLRKSLSDGRTTTAPVDLCNPGQTFNNNSYGCSYSVNQDEIICKYEGRDIPISDCDSLNLPGVNPLDGYSPEEIAMCKEELCPFCVDSNNVTHTLQECKTGGYYKPDGTIDKDTCLSALCPCPNCEITCVGACCSGVCTDPRATYPKGPLNLTLDYRTITASSVMPNKDSIGANWDIESENPIISEKASRTISEIEGRANKYNDKAALEKDKDMLADIKDYKFKIILTPSLIQWLKSYNHSRAKGNYGDKTLECYDYDLSKNIPQIEAEMGKQFADKIRKLTTSKKACKAAGYVWIDSKCIMDNIFCYSKVIDELYEDRGFKDSFDIEIMNKRNESKTTARYNMSVVKGTYNDAIMGNEYFSVYTASTFDITGDGLPDAGPAWK